MKFLQSVVQNINSADLDQQRTLILTTSAQSIRYLQTSIKSRISTLDSLVLAKFKTATNLELLIKLFSSYNKIHTDIDFNKFIRLGGALLHDFDVIDRCLVNPDDIFFSIVTQKQMSTTFSELPEKKQLMIIKFWNAFKKGKMSRHQEIFLKFWNSLLDIYNDFTKTLLNDNTPYSGLGYKLFADNIDDNIEKLKKNYDNVIMVGFFPIYQSDIKILNTIKANFHTLTFSQQDQQNDLSPNKTNINLYPLSTTSKQISVAVEKIKTCPPEKSLALVIPHDKQFLIQLLSALPPELTISSSLAFPVELTPSYNFITQLIRFFKKQIPIDVVLDSWFVKKNNILAEDLADQNFTLGKYLFYVLTKISKFYEGKDVLVVKTMIQQLEKIQDFFIDEKIIRSLLQNIQIPINTDVESNIHVLPLADTSNLDFDEVIILGANDSMLPSKIGDSSLIPYNLRKGYGLPTTDTTQYRLEKFYFYKLIYNSQCVHITYNSTLGDKSRFLYQLELESDLQINFHASQPLAHKYDKQLFLDTSYMDIDKEEIKKIKVLTPSMINMYLDCQYKFFLSMMMKEEKDEYNLGLLVHRALQIIYKKGTLVTENFLDSVDVQKVVDKVFSCHEIKSGEQLIDKDIAVLMVQKVLNLDKKYAPFEIFDVEYRAPEFSLVVDETIFQLNGIIDRIDKKDNVFRIIDYKTSLTKNTTKTLDELFEFGKNNRAKAVLQILLYSLMFKQNHENGIITPFIYDLRSNLDDIYVYVGKNKILDFDDSLRQALLANIEVFIEKMMNTNKVFINHGPLCQFCKFATLCQKN